MNKKTITVSEALRSKNIIDRKLGARNALAEFKFIDLKRKGVDKTLEGRDLEEAKKKVQSAFDTVESLLHNRYAYDKAIKQSNATTKITVAEKEYTIAEALEYIKSHEYSLSVVKEMKKQWETAKKKLMSENDSIDYNIQEQKNSILGSGDANPTAIAKITEQIEATEDMKRLEYIDPGKIEERITEMSNELDQFKMEVNDKINTSNATTSIEIELK